MPYRKAYTSNTRIADRWLLKVGAYAGLILGLSAIAMIWMAPFYFAHRSWNEAERSAYQDSANLARAFEEQLSRSIEAVDQRLLYVREKFAADPHRFEIAQGLRNAVFPNALNFQLAVVGADGRVIASTMPDGGRAPDLSDREHFRVHVERDIDELFISKPVLGRVSGQWSIQLTRRMSKVDGTFAGIVVASISPDYLGRFYRSIDVGKKGTVTLIGMDGIVRARGDDSVAGIGRSLAQGKVFKLMPMSDHGTFETRSPLDQIDRLYAYRKVKDYPLVVVVGQAKEEVFAPVLQHRREAIILAIMLTVWLGGITYLLWRYELALARSRDAAEAGTRARTEFLAMMSHEIRTPMNGVVGMSEVLLETELTPQQMTYAQTLRASAEHLLHLINDVLDFSKLEAGRFRIEAEPFAIDELVRSSIAALAPTAAAKGLTIEADIGPDVPRRIVTDPARLRQVLFNLIGNSLKFTQRGGVTVSVRVDPEAMLPGFTKLAFAVSDTGIGIPADGIPLLFKEFSQLDSSIARRFGGTGLGLAICRRLVTLLGGSIKAESVVGKGTAMRFTITAQVDTAAAASTPAEDRGTDAGEVRRDLKILLVEDNKTNQQVFLAMIGRLGLSADIANDGAEAVAACSRQMYDVVFMDVMMPGMDGLAATHAIRRMREPRRSMHIVGLTANANSFDREMCFDAGMNGFLAKPVTRAALFEKLGSIPVAARPAEALTEPASGTKTMVADELPIFDKKAYGELLNAIDGLGMAIVLRAFLDDMPKRLAVMRRAAATSDAATIRIEAHAIKSSAASIGFAQLSAVAKALEDECLTLAAAPLQSRVGDIAAAFVAIEILARAELGALPEVADAAAGDTYV